jgi:hypothetical protein
MDPSDRIYDAARQDGRGHGHVEGQNPFGSLTPPCSMSPWPRGDPLDASTASAHGASIDQKYGRPDANGRCRTRTLCPQAACVASAFRQLLGPEPPIQLAPPKGKGPVTRAFAGGR